MWREPWVHRVEHLPTMLCVNHAVCEGGARSFARGKGICTVFLLSVVRSTEMYVLEGWMCTGLCVS